jgi:hypothetical protein
LTFNELVRSLLVERFDRAHNIPRRPAGDSPAATKRRCDELMADLRDYEGRTR